MFLIEKYSKLINIQEIRGGISYRHIEYER